jgi:hypothetical protein
VYDKRNKDTGYVMPPGVVTDGSRNPFFRAELGDAFPENTDYWYTHADDLIHIPEFQGKYKVNKRTAAYDLSDLLPKGDPYASEALSRKVMEFASSQKRRRKRRYSTRRRKR